MIESNLLNPKQGIGLLGVSKKLQTCLRATHRQEGNAGKKHGQLMPFACIIEQAFNSSRGKGKMYGPFNKGNTNGQKGFLNIDSKNNLLSAENDKIKKMNRSFQVKGKGLVKNPHTAITGSEATGLRLPVQEQQTDTPHRQAKNVNAVGLFATAASKDKGVKTNGSIPGKIDLLSKRDGQKQTEGKVENLPGSSGLKKSKAEINNALMEDVRGPLKPGLNKQSIESVLPKSGLTGVVVEKDKAQVCVGPPEPFGGLIGPFGKRALHSGMRNAKNATAVFRDRGLKESKAGKNSHATVDSPGLLKSNLKNAVAVKGKSAIDPDKTGKNPFTLIKDEGGKNGVENLLERSILSHSPSRSPLHLPSHSIDKISSAGAYHHTSFHSGGSSSAVNESVNSHVIEPRALIDQIASRVKSPGRVRITLNPPRLGTLDVDVLVRDNKVHVILRAENNDVRQILQSNVESLKSSLRNHGLVADTINVSVQEKSDSANYGADYKSGQNETLFRESRNREGNEEDQGEKRDSLNHDPSSLEEENQRVRSDGRISLFA